MKKKNYELADSGMFRNLTWFVIGANYRQLILFIINIYLARNIGMEGFGFLSFGYATLLIFAALGDFGIRSIAWRELARVNQNTYMFLEKTGTYLKTRFFTSAISASLFIIFIFSLDKSLNECLLLSLFSISIIFNTMTFDWPFRSTELNSIPAFASLLFGSFLLITCFVFIKSNEDIFWFPTLLGLSFILTFCFLMYYYLKHYGYPIFKSGFSDIIPTIINSYPVGLNTLILRFNNVYPLIILGILIGDKSLGNFRTAHLIYSFVISFSLYFTGSVFSQLSKAHAKGEYAKIKSYIKKAVGIISVVFIPACIMLYFTSHILIKALFGDNIASANTPLFKILIFVAPFTILNNLLRELLTSFDKQTHMLLLNIIQLIFVIPIIYFSVTLYRLHGLAYGIVISEFIGFIVIYVYYRHLNAENYIRHVK